MAVTLTLGLALIVALPVAVEWTFGVESGRAAIIIIKDRHYHQCYDYDNCYYHYYVREINEWGKWASERVSEMKLKNKVYQNDEQNPINLMMITTPASSTSSTWSSESVVSLAYIVCR